MSQITFTRRTALRTLGSAVLVGGGASTAAAHRGGLKRELADVRSATAAYNDPSNAYADGYTAGVPLKDVVDKAHAVCGMGFHFGNFGLFGTVDRTNPQVLVYGVGDDELVLGAVEYLVPKTSDQPPDLFDHDGGSERWGTLPTEQGPDLWALHAWVHTKNPNGVFVPLNPRKQFSPDGCVSPGGHE